MFAGFCNCIAAAQTFTQQLIRFLQTYKWNQFVMMGLRQNVSF